MDNAVCHLEAKEKESMRIETCQRKTNTIDNISDNMIITYK